MDLTRRCKVPTDFLFTIYLFSNSSPFSLERKILQASKVLIAMQKARMLFPSLLAIIIVRFLPYEVCINIYDHVELFVILSARTIQMDAILTDALLCFLFL